MATTFAADPRVTGPSLGYVLDSHGGLIRPIHGIPGASTFSKPVPLTGLTVKAVSSVGRYAIATTEAGTVTLVNLEPTRRIAIDGVRMSPDGVALSASGSSAILFWKDGNHVQVVKGLPASPAIAFEADLPGSAVLMAVSDDGQRAAASVREGDGDALYSLTSANAGRLHKAAGPIGVIEFLRGTSDPMFADSVSAYRVGADGGVQKLADSAHIVGLAGDSQMVLLATPDRLSMIHLSDLSTKDVSCSCSITTLRRLADSVFRLTDAMDAPLWILDTTGEARVLFVPQAGGIYE